jgi:hypothetical protein
MHYHNCHQWSGEGSPSHTLLSGILTDYCVTGNRRLLEVAQEVADWAVRSQENCGIISCRNGVLHREFTGPLWSLLEVYRITWEEKYWDVAGRSINWFLRTIKEPGTYPVSVYTRGERGDEAVIEPYDGPLGHARDVYHLYLSALRLTDSKKLREHIIAEADYFLWEALTDNFVTAEMAKESLTDRSLLWKLDDEFYWTQWGTHGSFGTPILALAFDLTGDYKYAAYCKDHLEGNFRRQIKRSGQYAHWGFSYLWFGSYIPRLMKVVADAMDKDREALDRAEREWKERRAELGRPVYTGPGVDLKKDKMDCNGNIINRPPCDIPRQALPRQYDPKTNLGRLSTEDI